MTYASSALEPGPGDAFDDEALSEGQGLRDRQLIEVATAANDETSRQLTWLITRIKEAAPQALIVTP